MPSVSSPARWYDTRDQRFCGVFEGGAAKGVAYPGALQAVAEHGSWFCAVAGSSAGAITAAFVASGTDPATATSFTIEMFRLVEATRESAPGRRVPLFSGNALRDWLDAQLAQQIERLGLAARRPVDFAALHAASDIELFIVATNLSLKRQIVFSHLATPACGVAEAAVASSSTPLVFESRLLRIPGRDGRVRHHTIVDGGLWENFPMFVFADASFRRVHGAQPAEIDPTDIIGFILDDSPTVDAQTGDTIEFATDDEPIDAYEWSLTRAHAAPWWCRLLALPLRALAFLARLIDRPALRDRGRWPDPPTPCAKYALDAIDAVLGALSPLPIGVAVWLAVVAGSATAFWHWLAFLSTGGYPGWTMLLSVLAAVIFALPLLGLLLVGLAANSTLLVPARRTLYGLVGTYLASGGAPSWVKDRDNVVSLPLPSDLDTLGFADAVRRHASIIAAAQDATRRHLRERNP